MAAVDARLSLLVASVVPRSLVAVVVVVAVARSRLALRSFSPRRAEPQTDTWRAAVVRLECPKRLPRRERLDRRATRPVAAQVAAVAGLRSKRQRLARSVVLVARTVEAVEVAVTVTTRASAVLAESAA